MSLGSFFGAFGRRDEASADLPDTADEEAVAVAAPDQPALEPEVAPAPPAARASDAPAATLADARRELDAQAHRLSEVEKQLRSTLERLGRRTTEVRNLEARLKVMDPMVEQVRQRDLWLDEARKEVRKAAAERDAEAERRKALETDLAALRKEVDWRDYVIRDLEAMPEQLVRMRRDHAAALAERDAEIARLRSKAEETARPAAA
jgi:septal ring factor EnvC (AmiA/AmiB activator)